MKKILSIVLAIAMVAVMAVSAFAVNSPGGWSYNGSDNKVEKPSTPTKDEKPAGPAVQKTSDGTVVITTDNGDVVLTDIDGEWFEDDVIAIVAKGLMIGYPDGKFHPQDNVTVAMVYTVLARIAGTSIAATSGDEWIANAVAWAKANGIADDADPTAPATRAQMVKYLAAAAAVETDSLEWVLANDILIGNEKGELNLDSLMTRAEFATILNRYLALNK
ncbi:MAG: S-layer homology domain-containing protein [Ruminococcaceae bacterium]|jgi:hypothetical protein|nr:S-layer homology domain-containing protein [Oscillospiraceae bacterium]